MAWSLREKVRGVNGMREREHGVLWWKRGRGCRVGSGETWRPDSALATRIGNALADRPRVDCPRVGDVAGKSMRSRLTMVGHVAEPRTVRRIVADCPPLPKTVY